MSKKNKRSSKRRGNGNVHPVNAPTG